jgi:hypothetical protein
MHELACLTSPLRSSSQRATGPTAAGVKTRTSNLVRRPAQRHHAAVARDSNSSGAKRAAATGAAPRARD